MLRKTVQRLACATALALACAGVATPVAADAAPAHPLTQTGQVLYDYEALIYHLFGPSLPYLGTGPRHGAILCQNIVVNINGEPVTKHYWVLNADQFPKGEPPGDADNLYNCSPFLYTFTGFGPSPFHLLPDWFAINPSQDWIIFDQRAGAVQVNGRYVACNSAGTSVLGYFPPGVAALPGPPLMEFNTNPPTVGDVPLMYCFKLR